MAVDLQALEREWDARIAAADEEDRPQLRVDRAEAITAYWRNKSAEGDRQQLIVSATAQYPKARIAEITGSTAEEIEASAKASHEAIQAMIDAEIAATQPTEEQRQAAEEQAAQNAWGTAGGTAGAGATPPNPVEGEIQRMHDGLREIVPEGGVPAEVGGVQNSTQLKPGDNDRLADIALAGYGEALEARHGRRPVRPSPQAPGGNA